MHWMSIRARRSSDFGIMAGILLKVASKSGVFTTTKTCPCMHHDTPRERNTATYAITPSDHGECDTKATQDRPICRTLMKTQWSIAWS
jgi:hypothetical protein